MGAVARTVRIESARFLVEVADHDPDPRCRREAARALAALPLDPDAAGAALDVVRRGSGPAPAEPTVDKLAALAAGPATGSGSGAPDESPPHLPATETAAQVRATLHAIQGFPADLSALGALPVSEATVLLTDLLQQLLGRSARAGTADLQRATRRLGEVFRALSRDGGRRIVASLPDKAVIAVAEPRRTWAGSLLVLVDIAEILDVVKRLTEEAATRLVALRWLVEAAPRLADTPHLPAPAAQTAGLDRLQQLLEHGLDPPRPVRARFSVAVGDASAGANRTAYARLDAPERVAPRESFELDVGLGPSASRGVAATPLTVPHSAFELIVKILADGFEVLGGAALTRTIRVTPDDPYPYDVIRLRASADPTLASARTILATYSIGDRLIGVASRAVLVGEGSSAGTAQPAPTRPELNVDWVLPTETDPATRPDLELMVAPGNDAGGARRLFWYFRSPHTSVGERGFIQADLPDDVATQMSQIISGVEKRANQFDLAFYLRGVGRQIASAIPEEVWDALAAAARAANGPPSVLLATWDPYVPWELARVPQPWSADGPDVLGAQAVIGRWPYRTQSRSPAPPMRLDLRDMAVVSGVYAEGERLPEAEQEAVSLHSWYGAHEVLAQMDEVLSCLAGEPTSDVLHLAVHGRFDGRDTQDGIYLVDGQYLNPRSVLGVDNSPVRLAFLNACQLGQGREVLGEYAGMAASLLGIGAVAVVAPLWKVDDAVARTVAESFYPAVFAKTDAISPASFLREQRCATQGVEDKPAGTRLAYVFFGHPLLRVTWAGRTNGSGAASGPAGQP